MRNRITKKSFAVLLAAALVLSSVACSKQEKQANTQVSEVKLAADGVYPIKCSDTLTVWGDLNTSLSTQVKNFGETELAKELEKQTGVKVEYIHPAQGQLAEQFNLLIASNELPDIIRYSWYNFGPQAAIDSGYIMKLNDYMEEWAPNLTKVLKENPTYNKMVKTDEGSYYVFPSLRNDKVDCIYSGPIIRQDWLDNLNMEVPTTIEEWETMLKAFKNELEVAIPLAMTPTHLTKVFMGAYGIDNTYFINKNGEIVYGPAQKEYKDCLSMLNRWYKEGLLDPNIANVDGKTIETNMLNDRLGATLGGASGGIGSWMNAKAADKKFKLVGAPYPVLNKGDRPMFSTREWEYFPGSSYAISSQCKNPELAVRFMDYGYSKEGRMLYNFGVEGVTYDMVDGKPIFKDKFKDKNGGLSEVLDEFVMGTYSGPFVQDSRVVKQMQEKPSQVRKAVLTWADTDAEKYERPLLYLTKEEQAEMSNIGSEISTYVTEMQLKFIVGSEPLSKFDDYLKQLDKFKLDRAIKIYTEALKRYNSK